MISEQIFLYSRYFLSIFFLSARIDINFESLLRSSFSLIPSTKAEYVYFISENNRSIYFDFFFLYSSISLIFFSRSICVDFTFFLYMVIFLKIQLNCWERLFILEVSPSIVSLYCFPFEIKYEDLS